jgi:hypothetical protein
MMANTQGGWSRWAAPFAFVVAAMTAVLAVAWVPLLLTMPPSVPADDATKGQLAYILPLVVMGVIALLLSIRRPHNPVGWLLGGSGLVLMLLLTCPGRCWCLSPFRQTSDGQPGSPCCWL